MEGQTYPLLSLRRPQTFLISFHDMRLANRRIVNSVLLISFLEDPLQIVFEGDSFFDRLLNEYQLKSKL